MSKIKKPVTIPEIKGKYVFALMFDGELNSIHHAVKMARARANKIKGENDLSDMEYQRDFLVKRMKIQ